MYIKVFEDNQIKCIDSIQIHGFIWMLSFLYEDKYFRNTKFTNFKWSTTTLSHVSNEQTATS